MAVHKSMYERLVKSLEEATELSEKMRETLSHGGGAYEIAPAIDDRINSCKQTIRAGKAFIATLKGEEDGRPSM